MRLAPRVVTAATTWPVDLVAAKEYCVVNIDDAEFNAEIEALLDTANSWLQPPFGCLRLSIAEQTLRLDLPCWPVGAIELPAGPVQAITSVKYFDQSNAEQTLNGANYFLDNDTLCWAETFSPPSVYSRPSAVKITYSAGYAPDDCPAAIKTAIKQCVKHWFDNRDAVQAVGAMNMMPLGVDDLIANYRVR